MSEKDKVKSVLEDVLRNDATDKEVVVEVKKPKKQKKQPRILYAKENIASTAVNVDELTARLEKSGVNFAMTIEVDSNGRDVGWVKFEGGARGPETCTIMQPVESTVRRAYDYIKAK